ncbi:MAG: hypothetical protein COT71_00465 [Candidatus Andersenbacteria bacterium CG10_big_fil_rev_8_21_14_0_10_54_11]|uniref:Uncharacterized protein n=1 Tax=Candidatus Andersenbacteria bacterium CG10_big_fil_rev_8_21_14_0_10_54_11 TaxID=1974485 RepID=A0A2M6X0H6_9BACT|nr:MAG: hypothetical protein COT71_00465 [Candidatus Andersenbacteria bacterium CG10_big_fil_rev_8_21_14_0_10_54_11]
MSTLYNDELGFVTAEVLPGKTNALVKNLMRPMEIDDPNEAVRRVNSGEWIVVQREPRWREEDRIIYFTVTSGGTIGACSVRAAATVAVGWAPAGPSLTAGGIVTMGSRSSSCNLLHSS